MNTNRTTRSILAAIFAFFALAFIPAAAHAAATVTVSVGQTEITVPKVQSYNFSMSFDSTPDRYTVEIVKPNGSLYEPAKTVAIGSASPINGSGTLDLPANADEGYWTVKVAYFAKGQPAWEARAQKVFRVTQAPVVAPGPTPVTPAPVAPAPAPERTPEPRTPDAVIPPQSAPSTPVIGLTKRTSKKVVKGGQTVPFTLRVTNKGSIPARNVQVCDTIPSRMTVTKIGKGRFSNGKLCYKVGTLAPGKSATIKLSLRVDKDAPKGTIVNRATATATGAKTVKASAKVKVKKITTTRKAAPVTG